MGRNVVIVLLLAVVVAAVAFMVLKLGKDVPASKHAMITGEVHLACGKCGAEMDMATADFLRLKVDTETGRRKCTKCGELALGVVMRMRCASCGKMIPAPPMDLGATRVDQSKYICPLCGKPAYGRRP